MSSSRIVDPPAAPPHGNNFNLVRLVLALLVIVAHAAELQSGDRGSEILTLIFGTMSFGEFGVAGFFLLSGYLIVKSWESKPAASAFLKKRVLRIYPGFIVASAICVFVVGPLAGDAGYFSALSIPTFLLNLVLLKMPETPAVFSGLHYELINAAMWTIRFEFLMYLTVLGFGYFNLLRAKHLWLLATIAIMLVEVAHYLGLRLPLGPYPDVLNLQPIRLSMFFFAGGTLYLYKKHIALKFPWAVGCAVATFGLMFFPLTANLALASIGGYALLYFCITHIAVLTNFNKLPDVSYGAYLGGWPITQLLLWYVPGISLALLTLLSVVLSIAYGVFSWYCVEQPFIRWKSKIPRGQLPSHKLPI